MSRFAPLAVVTVRHAFFRDEPCPAVSLSLDAPSAELARRAGLLLRSRPGQIAVLHDLDRRDALELYAADASEPFRLDLRVEARDPVFFACTAPGVDRPDAILAFDSRAATRNPDDGSYRLSVGEHVSEEDLAPLGSERVASVLGPREPPVRPAALVRIHLAGPDGALAAHEPEEAGPVYRLDFRARETYWRYLLLGDLAGRSVSIVDVDMEARFEPGGPETLPGDRAALSFRSTTPLPLRERSDRRFQLRADGGSGAGNGRVLIRRLPVASPGGTRRRTIDGRPAFVSDIYVNG